MADPKRIFLESDGLVALGRVPGPVLSESNTWNDAVRRIDERGGTRFGLVARHYVVSECGTSPALEPETALAEAEETTSVPAGMKFLELVNRGRG